MKDRIEKVDKESASLEEVRCLAVISSREGSDKTPGRDKHGQGGRLQQDIFFLKIF